MRKLKTSRNDFQNLTRVCACCGKEIKVKLFPDRTYSGGHYFFKIPSKAKTLEYWECDGCYK